MGTELRFKSQLPSKRGPALSEDQKAETRVSSERWHANAIHVASVFLPDECPLVGHMINSYKKHHLKNKPPRPVVVKVETAKKKTPI